MPGPNNNHCRKTASALPPACPCDRVDERVALSALARAETDLDLEAIWRPALQKYLLRLRGDGQDLSDFPGSQFLDHLFQSAERISSFYPILIPLLVLTAKSRYFYVVRDVFCSLWRYRLADPSEMPDPLITERALEYVSMPAVASFFRNLFRNPEQVEFRCPNIEFVHLPVAGLYCWSTMSGIYINVFAENAGLHRRNTFSNAFCLFVQILREMARYYARCIADNFVCYMGDREVTERLKGQGFNFRGHECPWPLAAELLFVGGSVPTEYAEHPRAMLQLLESRLGKCSSEIQLPLMLPKERKNINLKWSDYETEYDFSYRPQIIRS